MDEAHKIAFERSKRSKHREQTLEYTALEVGDRVLVKNKKEQGGPGKLLDISGNKKSTSYVQLKIKQE